MTTYTPSLRLWMGQPGDPAIKNIWGTALNTNDSLLDSSITGTAFVDLTGLIAYSLTVANGAPDQSRPQRQSYTGTPLSNCTVTLPNVPKIGIAQNSTTGGFNVILTTGAGTNATIPADGAWYLFSCDGSGNVTLPPLGLPFGKFQAGNNPGTSAPNAGVVNVVSLSLDAGDWEVDGVVQFNPPGGTNFTGVVAWVSDVVSTIPTMPTTGYINLAANFTGDEVLPTGPRRFLLAATTQIWLGAFCTFTGSGVATVIGSIQARRMQ